jgi:hypothetical protein
MIVWRVQIGAWDWAPLTVAASRSTFADAAVTVASVSLLACAVSTVQLGRLVVGVLKTE